MRTPPPYEDRKLLKWKGFFLSLSRQRVEVFGNYCQKLVALKKSLIFGSFLVSIILLAVCDNF